MLLSSEDTGYTTSNIQDTTRFCKTKQILVILLYSEDMQQITYKIPQDFVIQSRLKLSCYLQKGHNILQYEVHFIVLSSEANK